MSTVIKCINFIKSRGLNKSLFKKFLEDFNADYHNLIYYCEVRWMSRSEMLTPFHLVRNEIGQFMDMQENSVVELSGNRWLCDLAFMVDISKHFSELSIKLQGPNQLLNYMFAKVKSFETKLQLWKVQLQNNNTTYFPSLQEQNYLPQQNMRLSVQRFLRHSVKDSRT